MNQALRPIALVVLATSARKSDFLSVGIELLAVSRHRKSRNPNQGMLGWRVHTQIVIVDWLLGNKKVMLSEERKSSIGCVAKSELNISANSWKHWLKKGWADHNYFDRSCIWLEDCIHRFKIDTQFIFASAEYLKHRSEGRC